VPSAAVKLTDIEQHALAVVRRSADVRAIAARDDGHVPGDVRDDLDAIATTLRSASPTPSLLDALAAVDDERVAVQRFAVERRRTVLLQIRDSISRLRALPTRSAIVEAAPVEACRSCGLARSLLSRIDGITWVPQILWTEGPEGEPGDFRSYLEQSRIPLEHMLLETEMVRRGRPALVPDARGDERTHQAIILASGASAYVAAPIVTGRRAVGFLHCDRLGQEQPLTEQDRDNLWTFTEHLAVILEGVAITERLTAIEDQARRITDEALGDLDVLRTTPVTCGEERPGAIAPSGTDGSAVNVARLLLALTERERQVLELMSTGASNLEIADALVVSEGTIKTHVNRILRKLRVDNRAQAAARHLQASPQNAAT
jgi:DNA-binding CsgD family transcriptional regulator